MAKAKLVKVYDPGNCYFIRVPSRLFAENILQRLSFNDLMKLSCAITNHNLRKTWWLANEKKPAKNAEEVLKYAIDDKIGLQLFWKKQIKHVIKLGLRSSHIVINFSGDIDTPTFRKLIQYLGGVVDNLELWSCIEIVKLRCITTEIKSFLDNLKSFTCRDIWLGHMLDDMYRSGLQESLFFTIAAGCYNLENLNINLTDQGGAADSENIRFTIIALNNLIRHNPKLESINIENCPVSAEVIEAIATKSIHLKRLSFIKTTPHRRNNDDVTDHLASIIPRLSSIQLVNVMAWDEESNGEVNFNKSLTILSKCSSLLTSIDFSNSWRLQLNDACIDMISSRCPNLEHLKVNLNIEIYRREYDHEWGQITNDAIVLLSERCPLLKSIGLIRNPKITQVVIDPLLSNCLQIQEIDIFMTNVDKTYIRQKRDELRAVKRKVLIVEHPSDRRFAEDYY